MTSNSTTITTINPATEETITTYDLMSKDAAFEKVVACHAAFLQWRTTRHEERATYLRDIAGALRRHANALAALMTAETGKLLRDGHTEVELCAQIFEYTAEHGPVQLADESRTHSGGHKAGVVAYCPIGVVYSIQPWNFPVYQPVRVLAANLMAGNGVILKHASICTGSGLMLRDLCLEAGLPTGLFDVVLVDHDVSDAIIAHDVPLAVKFCVQGRLYNNGETCVSAKRFVVTAAVYDNFVGAFVEQMKAITMGEPSAEDTQLGPVASKEQFDILSEQVTKSIAGGATLLCGGVPDKEVGYYFPATVLADCQPGTPAYDDELFGPVASIIKASDDADAMRIANDSRYGLGGGIFTKDENKAFRLARDHFDTGMVRINTFGTADPNMPFGGVKDSGYGREHGGFGMKEFVNVKAIYMQQSVQS